MSKNGIALALAAGLLGCALTGCHSDPAAITYAQYVAQYTKAYCESVFKCCQASDISQQNNFTDEPSCETYVAAGMPTTLPAVFVFDGKQAAICLAFLEGELSSCDVKLSQTAGLSECGGVFQGTLKMGDTTCGDDQYNNFGDPCGAGMDCYFDATNPVSSCQKTATLNEPCGDAAHADCAPGLTCEAPGCVKPLPNGAACDNDNYACDSIFCANNVCTDAGSLECAFGLD